MSHIVVSARTWQRSLDRQECLSHCFMQESENILAISSPANPRVKRMAALRKARDRRKEGVFIAEGLREVSRAMEGGLRPLEVYFVPAAEELARRIASVDARAMLFAVTPAILTRMSYLDEPEGIVALFEQPRYELERLPAPSPRPRSEADLWLVAVGTEKPGNLGAMARSAAAAGAWGLLAADAEVDPFNPNAIRASTGAVFTLPVVSASTAQLLEFLDHRRVRIIAATPDAAQPYDRVDMTGPIAIVIGAEDRGLDAPWRDAAQRRGQCVRIPILAKGIDSLNASVCAGILLYEAVRQRGEG